MNEKKIKRINTPLISVRLSKGGGWLKLMTLHFTRFPLSVCYNRKQDG